MKDLSHIYCITKNTKNTKNLRATIQILIDFGIRIFQYRDKEQSKEQYRKSVASLKSMIASVEGRLIVNDHIDIAIEEDLGLHIGWEDLETYAHQQNLTTIDALLQIRDQLSSSNWLGVTVHNDIEKISMVSSIVDYVGVGPIFPTTTKLDTKELIGLELLQKICSSSNIPIVAVGGITTQNLPEVVHSGASFFAMCSEIFDAQDVQARLRHLSLVLKKANSIPFLERRKIER